MRNFFIFIFLTLTLVGSMNAAEKNNGKVNCHWRLQLESPNSKKTCFSDYPLEEEISLGRKLVDLTKNANCYSIALSNDQQCRGIGFANTWDQFCEHAKGVELQQKDALENCKKSGCPCEIVISNHKIINENFFRTTVSF